MTDLHARTSVEPGRRATAAGIRCSFQDPDRDGARAGRGHPLGRVNFGERGPSVGLGNGVPRLEVPATSTGVDAFAEVWSTASPSRPGEHRGICFAHDGEYLLGAGAIPARAEYRSGVRDSYESIFDLVRESGYPHIFRIWNFIGRINQDNARGLEVYRDFCQGRAEAFEAARLETAFMPAATGIGSRGAGIAFFFLACRDSSVRHIENPHQIPAYRYPRKYGPRSPSFARATYLRHRDTRGNDGTVFISGTASILGYETVHRGDIEQQCDVALRNIANLVGPSNRALAHDVGSRKLQDLRHVKVYVRHAEHLPIVRERVARAFPPPAEVAFLNVDICRSDLLVEIEGVLPVPGEGGECSRGG